MDDIAAKMAMIDPTSQLQSCVAYSTKKFILDVLTGRIKGEGERVVVKREVLRLRKERAALVYGVITKGACVGVPFLSGTTCITGKWAPPCLL